jgi:hypothetical protein
MSYTYAHDERWPANTWINLWIETYNRPPVLPTEIRPWLEKLGLDVLNPEQGLFSVFGESLVSFDEEQEIGKAMVLVRDPRGTMTKAALLRSLESAPWTPKVAGPHLPSVSYWPSLPDVTRDSQDALNKLWLAQGGGEGAVSTVEMLGTVLRVAVVGAVGIGLYAMYKRLVPESKKRSAKKGRRR